MAFFATAKTAVLRLIEIKMCVNLSHDKTHPTRPVTSLYTQQQHSHTGIAAR